MCSVGDMFDIDISGDAELRDYVCNVCGKKFKGLGNNLRCPACHSTNVKSA